MQEFINVLKQYAVFEGRTTRKEYWVFILVYFVIYVVLVMVLGSGNPILTLFQLALFLPSISAGIRRMHDIDKSGWFLIIPFYGIYLSVLAGTTGPNRFGADHKQPDPINQ